MDPFGTTKSNFYEDQENFAVVPDISSEATNYYNVDDSSEDNQFYNDYFDQRKEPIDSTLKHSNNEDVNMDWYYSALEDILSAMDNIEADNNETINSSVHALFGNKTMSVLEQELFFENEMTSFDVENYEVVTDDLTETIFFTNGTDNQEFGIDNSAQEMVIRSECTEFNTNECSHKEDDVIDLTETVVRSECNELNNNDFSHKKDNVIDFTETFVRSECTGVNNNDYSPKEDDIIDLTETSVCSECTEEEDHVNDLSVSETPLSLCKTILTEKIHQPDGTNSPKEAFDVNGFDSSLETPQEQYETTPSKTNPQQEEKILGENYLFELKCTHCNKTLSVNECLSHLCTEQIKTTETFSCKRCDCTFSDKDELNAHEKTHFTCSICGRNLAAQFSLKRHYRLVHGKTNVIFL